MRDGFVVGFGGFVGGEVEAVEGGAPFWGPLCGRGCVGDDGEGVDCAGAAAEGVIDVFVEGGEEAGIDVGDRDGDAEKEGGVGFVGVLEHGVDLLFGGAEGGAGGGADVVVEVEAEAFIEEKAVDAGLRGEIGEIVGDGGGLFGELREPAGFRGGGGKGQKMHSRVGARVGFWRRVELVGVAGGEAEVVGARRWRRTGG